MSVEAPNTGFTPAAEDPMAQTGVLTPEAWTPHASVGTGEHLYAAGVVPAPGTFEQAFPTQTTPETGEFGRRVENLTVNETPPAQPSGLRSEDVKASLSADAKQNLYRLANSTDENDVKAFGELLSTRLTPGEKADYEAFRAARDAEVVATRQAAAVPAPAPAPMPEVTPAVRPEDQKAVQNLLLHSLKLRNPEEFRQKFNALSGAEKGSFDAFEAREDARIKTNVPSAAPMIPKLSADGERFITPVPQAQTPQPLNTEAAAARYGAAADFHPVAPRAPGQARDEFEAAVSQPATTRGRLAQAIKGLPRKFTRRPAARRQG